MKAVFGALLTILLSTTALAHPGHDAGHLIFQNGRVHAHLSWDVHPEVSQEAKMKIEWHDGATHALIEPDFSFNAVLFMPSMGHGSGPTKIRPVSGADGQRVVGTYQVYNMYFVMPGDWEVRVNMKDANGNVTETQAWAVDVAGDDDGGHDHH